MSEFRSNVERASICVEGIAAAVEADEEEEMQCRAARVIFSCCCVAESRPRSGMMLVCGAAV
jgi:hypothetical protein